MTSNFDLNSIQQSAATFDIDKLLWVNQQHMKNATGIDLSETLEEYFTTHDFIFDGQPDLCRLFDAMKDRCKTLHELCNASEFFYHKIKKYDIKAAEKNLTKDKLEVLSLLKTRFSNIKIWTANNIHAEIKGTADDMNLKLANVAPSLRLAVTGGANSPSIDCTLELLGAEKTEQRISNAIEYIESTV